MLGVSRDATPDEIKSVYRQLARTFHPDVSQDADAEERFKTITQAFLLLNDPERRARWDAGRRDRPRRAARRARRVAVEETEIEIGLRLAGIDLGGLLGVSVLVRRRTLFEDPEPPPSAPLALPPGR